LRIDNGTLAVNSDHLRIAIIFHRLGPYHWARLTAAAKIFDIVAIELSAESLEYSWDKIDKPSNFRRVTLFDSAVAGAGRGNAMTRRINDALTAENPLNAVAIPGWSSLGALTTLKWCLRQGVPAILMSESTQSDRRRYFWPERIKAKVVQLFNSAIVGGRAHKEYLVRLGMAEGRVFAGYDVVDNEFFANKADDVRRNPGATRERLNLPVNYFLASSRFLPKKNLVRLLEAYARYRRVAGSGAWDLVLLGDGPLSASIEGHRKVLGLDRCVHLPGFKQYDELPIYYALAGAFAHASVSEPWGLVVNEAMASGLPIIVSKKCGCVSELLAEGRNGFSFAPEDVNGLADLLLRMAALPDVEREGMAQASREIIASWSVERFANGLRGAVRAAKCAPRKKIQPSAKLLLSSLIFARRTKPTMFAPASSRWI